MMELKELWARTRRLLGDMVGQIEEHDRLIRDLRHRIEVLERERLQRDDTVTFTSAGPPLPKRRG